MIFTDVSVPGIRMYQIGIFTVLPELDIGQIVESAVRPELEFTIYRIVMITEKVGQPGSVNVDGFS